MRRHRILVLGGGRGITRAVRRSLASAGHEIVLVERTLEALASALDGSADLAIIDAALEGAQLDDMLDSLRRQRPSLPTLLVSNELGDRRVVDQVLDKGINHVVAKHSGLVTSQDLIDETEIIATVHKLLSGDIFGIEKYLATSSVAVHQEVVTTSPQRAAVLESLGAFLEDIDCYKSMEPMILAVADELLMNAIFSAPRDDEGKPKYDHWHRSTDFDLEAHEHVECRYACDGRNMLLSVSDRFGSLDRGTIMKCLGRGLLGEKGLVQAKSGGAGLGLYMVAHSITQLIFNIQEGVRTEVIAIFYIRSGVRGLRASGQSLNLFLEH